MSRTYLKSRLTPEQIFDNLRARGREWRESHLPEAVRRRGGYGVRVHVEPPSFVLLLEGTWKREATDPEVLGVVRASADGGSEVEYRARLQWAFPSLPLGLGVVAFLIAVLPAVRAGLVVPAVGRMIAVLLGTAAVWWAVDRLKPRRSAELVELERVIRGAAGLGGEPVATGTGAT